MFISDQEMFLRDTLDPASKMHRLPIDAVRDAGVFSGAVGITPALIFGYLICLFFRGSPKKKQSTDCPLPAPGGSLQAPPAFPMLHSRGIP